MKKILTYISVLLAVCSCSWFDDSKIWEELREHEERIEKLEAICGRLNSNVEALQGIMEALEANDYVTDITRIMEDGVEVGYSITFAKGGTITVYHGVDGADASAPKIGIRKASDGEYYWTADGEWMTDEDGEMIPVVVLDDPDGKYITPLFRVAESRWYVSYDGGNTWMEIENLEKEDDTDNANGQGCSFFQNVGYDKHHMYITLNDGTLLTIPISSHTQIVDLFIFMGQSNMVGYGNASEAPIVPDGWGYEYKASSSPNALLPLVEPFGLNEDSGAQGSLVSSLAISYYNKTMIPIVGVSCSRGGSSSTYWMPGGNALNTAISRFSKAENWLQTNGYTIRHKYMFWLQGETDAVDGVAIDKYKSNIIAIVKEMVLKTGIEKCMMIRVGLPNNPSTPSSERIIQAQTELCQTYHEIVMTSMMASSFVDNGLMSSTWHYTQKGYNLLGSNVGTNVAFFVNTGKEPYMYDTFNDTPYIPVDKSASVFDYVDNNGGNGDEDSDDDDIDNGNSGDEITISFMSQELTSGYVTSAGSVTPSSSHKHFSLSAKDIKSITITAEKAGVVGGLYYIVHKRLDGTVASYLNIKNDYEKSLTNTIELTDNSGTLYFNVWDASKETNEYGYAREATIIAL